MSKNSALYAVVFAAIFVVGVAVGGFCPDGGQLVRADGRQLVRCQRFCRCEIQGDRAAVVNSSWLGEHAQFGAVDGVQRGQLVRQRFSGGRAGGDYHVAAGVGYVGRLNLMPVGLLYSQVAVGSHKVRVNPLRPGFMHCPARRDGPHMPQLLRIGAAAQ